MRYRTLCFVMGPMLLIVSGCNVDPDNGGSAQPIIAISNKISSLPAGASYEFNLVEGRDQEFEVRVEGQGTIVSSGLTATYIAPPEVPSPASVTVFVTPINPKGVSDSDTFTITRASGPVVSISPAAFSVYSQLEIPVTLHIAVTQDSAADLLTIGMPNCTEACGSFGAISGTPGSGAYTVEYHPPIGAPQVPEQQIEVTSSLVGATAGVGFVTIIDYWGY